MSCAPQATHELHAHVALSPRISHHDPSVHDRLGPPRPCCRTGPSSPMAQLTVSSSVRGVIAWCVVCSVHRARLPLSAFAYLLGRPSTRGCCTCGPVLFLLPAPAPVLHLYAILRRGSVADACLSLA